MSHRALINQPYSCQSSRCSRHSRQNALDQPPRSVGGRLGVSRKRSFRKKEIFDSGAAGHHLNKPVTTVHELGGGFAHTTLDVAQDQGIDDLVDTLSMPLLIANNVGDPASPLKRCSACTLASKLMILRTTAHAS